MKTITQINGEIMSLAKEVKRLTDVNERRAAQKIQREVEQLRFFKLYLETNPREETILKMRKEIEHRIEVLDRRFGQWSAGKSEDPKVLKSKYNALMGMNELKSKLKALNYLCE